jgi:protein-disulfide isomerase
VAVVAAAALVAAALISRSHTSVTERPVVQLSGIPQVARTLGSPHASVTLIEWADAQCPACRAYTEELFPIAVDEYVRPGQLKMEFRGFPFIGPDSVTAYRFLLAAGRQNRLWNLQEAMYRHQGEENGGWVTDELIRTLSRKIPGLDVDRLFRDARQPDIVAEATAAVSVAHAAGIRGTPTLLVQIGQSTPYLIRVGTGDDLRAALDDALSS